MMVIYLSVKFEFDWTVFLSYSSVFGIYLSFMQFFILYGSDNLKS